MSVERSVAFRSRTDLKYRQNYIGITSLRLPDVFASVHCCIRISSHDCDSLYSLVCVLSSVLSNDCIQMKRECLQTFSVHLSMYQLYVHGLLYDLSNENDSTVLLPQFPIIVHAKHLFSEDTVSY